MTLLKAFRYVAVLEGIIRNNSLKYFYEMPEPNFYIGMAHGLLFLLYCAVGLSCAIQYQWKIGFSIMVFFSVIDPFGTFYLEAKYLKE